MFIMKTLMVLVPIFQFRVCKPSELIVKTITSGNNLSLSCKLSRRDESVVLWKKDERVLFAGDLRVRMDDRLSVNCGNLEILDVDVKDKGEYKCETESKDGELSSLNYAVEILQKAEAKISVGSQLTVKTGTRLSVTCSGSGIPLPEVRWRRRDTVLAVGFGVCYQKGYWLLCL
jgi:hypothetical protein